RAAGQQGIRRHHPSRLRARHGRLLLVAGFTELAQDAVEVLDRREADLDGAAARREIDLDLRVEAVAELLGHLVEVRAARARLGLRGGLARRLAGLLDPLRGRL